MFIATLITAFSAHAAVTVTQYTSSDIVSFTTDYSYDCRQTEKTSYDGWHVVNPQGTIVVTTTTGVLNLHSEASSNGIWTANKSNSMVKERSAKEACEGVKDSLVSNLNEQLGYLFEVKSAELHASGKICFVNDLRVIHDGENVQTYSYEPRIIHCP